jgi:ABC-type bacteriocin/lantibiotic exporter with double-glycine peptidase domain
MLFMDEGTSHLDAAVEAKVNAAVCQLGLTRIIIAHRRETIETAERCLAMVDGRLSEIPARRDIAEAQPVSNVTAFIASVAPAAVA